MRVATGAVLGAMLGLAVAPVARADGPAQPFVTPQHDVDVTYAMLPGENPTVATQRLRWSTALQAQRIDVPGAPTYVVTDHRHHLTAAIRTDGHGFVKEAAPGDVPPTGSPAPGGYTPVAGPTVQIAGLSCREWQIAQAGDQGGVSAPPSTVCFTDDGILLRARIGARVLLLAQSVQSAPLDPALFAIPDGPAESR